MLKDRHTEYFIPADPNQHLYVPYEETNPVKWMKDRSMIYSELWVWPLGRFSAPLGKWRITLKQHAA